jgi:tetratricopeptide (TPR) repeat protein
MAVAPRSLESMSRKSSFISVLALALGCGVAVGNPVVTWALAAPPQGGSAATPPPPSASGAPSAAGAAGTNQRLADAAAAANEPLQRASALAKAGKLKEAIAELEAQRKKGGATPRSLSFLGTLYLQVGRPADALAVLKPLADASDAEPATLYQAGRACLTLHKPSEAQGYFQRSLALEPASPAARELGLILAHQGQAVEAYSLLRPWAVRNANDGEALLTAAQLALELERPLEAAQMIAGMPENDPAIVLLRSKILVEKGDGKSAVPLLTPLLAKHPPGMEPEVRRTLAEADLLAGQPAQAVALLDGRTSGHPSLALVLGKAQHQSGAPAAALETLRPFADQLPDDPKGIPDPRVAGGIAVEYGRLLTEGGHVPEGIAFLQKATRIEPNSKETWDSLAKALNAAGRKDEAQKAAAQSAALAQAAVKTGGQ